MSPRKRPRHQAVPDSRLGLIVETTTTTTSHETAATSAAPSRLLQQLADSCNEHHAHHQKNKKSSRDHHAALEQDDQEVAVPAFCHKALTILRKLLPRVEKQYRATGQTATTTTPLDVRHLCDFYCNVVEGGFCRHAPHLFRLGKGAVEVLPRVFSLVQHTLSPSVIAHHTLAEKAATSSTATTPLVESISSTTARLLDMVPGIRLELAILRDLIQMIEDLCFLQQHHHHHDTLASGTDNEPDSFAAEMVLFPQTVHESDLDDKSDVLVELTDAVTIAALQSCLAGTLHQFLELRKHKRLYPADDCTELFPHGGFEPTSLHLAGLTTDCPELICSLADSLRHMMVAAAENTAHGTRDEDHRTALAFFARRSAVAALRLADFLVMDHQESTMVMPESVVTQWGLLAVEGTLEHLRAQHMQESAGVGERSPALAALLRRLFVAAEETPLSLALLPLLLECVGHMYRESTADELVDKAVAMAVWELVSSICSQTCGAVAPLPCPRRSINNYDSMCQNAFRAMRDARLAQHVMPLVLAIIKSDGAFCLQVRDLCSDITNVPAGSAETGAAPSEMMNQGSPADEDDYDISEPTGSGFKRRKLQRLPCADPFDAELLHFIKESLGFAVVPADGTVSGASRPKQTADKCVAVAASFRILLTVAIEMVGGTDCNVGKALVTLATSLSSLLEELGRSMDDERSEETIDPTSLALEFVFGANSIDLLTSVDPALSHALEELLFAFASYIQSKGEPDEVTWAGAYRHVIACAEGDSPRRQAFRLRTLRKLLQTDVEASELKVLQAACCSSHSFARSIGWDSVCFLFGHRMHQENVVHFMRTPATMLAGETMERSGTCPAMFLLDNAFGAPNHLLCEAIGDFAAGRVVPGLLVAFADDDQLSHLIGESSDTSRERLAAIHSSSNRFFNHIDHLLHRFCCVPLSQLSLSETSAPGDQTGQRSAQEILNNKRSAIRFLVALCAACDVTRGDGRHIFQRTLLRVFRLWANPDEEHPLDTPGFCFGEVLGLFAKMDSDSVVQSRLLTSCAPSLFLDTLSPLAGEHDQVDQDSIDQQYRILWRVLKMFALHKISDEADTLDDVVVASSNAAASRGLDECLPAVLAHLILEKEYGTLRLTAGFKLFILAHKQLDTKVDNRSQALIQQIGDRVIWRHKLKRPWVRDLDNHIYLLAQSPGVVEQMLPLVMQKAGRSELLFLSKDVLKNNRTLMMMLTARDQLMLKGFVKELGKSTDAQPALRALTMAAIAREDSSSQVLSGGDHSSDAASAWVSSRFMYLLVNVVQSHWSAKEPWEKIEDMRSLNHVLGLLRTSDKAAAQYLPQIMATVNGAISKKVEGNISIQSSEDLRLLGVQCMSKFIRLVAQINCEIIGENLASLVVSLLPVVGDSSDAIADHCVRKIRQQAQSDAFAMIQFLSDGELGGKLLRSFRRISFLFRLPALQKVKSSLQSRGIDFDSSQASGPEFSSASAGGSADSSSKTRREIIRKQETLGDKIGTISGLVSHEDVAVRLVVLEHLTELLRENREAFRALVSNEMNNSTKRFLTVPLGKGRSSSGIVTELMENLLARCAQESGHDVKLLLASSLGEIGAIAEHRLNNTIKLSWSEEQNEWERSHGWMLDMPPWKAQPEVYGLRLVTRDLVCCLRAAPSSSDQHKIGFAIQQLLVILQSRSGSELSKKEPLMASWLSGKLSDAGVLELVEPFWQSEFHEQNDGHHHKQPPFFCVSHSYLSWISNWCRHMVFRARNSIRSSSKFSAIFFACRTALRTAATGVAEFLLPLLILDRLCFGDATDESAIVKEMTDTLTLNSEASMKSADAQKAVNAVLAVAETFQYWLERDVEERHSRKATATANDIEWKQDEATMRIEDILEKVPFGLQAKAAARVGMSARSLRLFEVASRQELAKSIFGDPAFDQMPYPRQLCSRSRAAGICPAHCVDLMKSVLSSLDDNETLMCLTEQDSEQRRSAKITDSIREKVASRDWSSALQEHERALQVGCDTSTESHQRGILQCLLELGQYESVLNQVRGINAIEKGAEASTSKADLVPYATQAAWRLGRWDLLDTITRDEGKITTSLDGIYDVCLGKAMLAVHQHRPDVVIAQVRDARCAVMDKLSFGARDSYARSYEQMVRLRSLQEVEGLVWAKEKPGMIDKDVEADWSRRLQLAAPESAIPLINVRIALARLTKDSALEGRLFLDVGRRARKNREHNIAANAFSRAAEAFNSGVINVDIEHLCALQLERAKLKHQMGESSAALRLLDFSEPEGMSDSDTGKARREAIRKVAAFVGAKEEMVEERVAIKVFAGSAVKSIKWTIEGGLKGGNEIMNAFRVIHCVAPQWEKGHFRFAKYVETVMQSRVALLQRRASPNVLSANDVLSWNQVVAQDKSCQKYLLLAVRHYKEALIIELKHLYQALPRMLSLWFQFLSVDGGAIPAAVPVAHTQAPVGESLKREMLKQLSENQEQLNAYVSDSVKKIPAPGFYSAIAQLVSRVTHENKDTRVIVRSILGRVLAKFPQQTMWHLAWLNHSKDSNRREIGSALLKDAETALGKVGNHEMRKLLVASKSLIRYLHDLARYEVKDIRKAEVSVKPWCGEVPLSAFVPPVQAALSLSATQYSDIRSVTVFASQIPRMRTFCRRIQLMASKARPKRVKAFAVADGHHHAPAQDPSHGARPLETDIGEMHFLIKQEAKGDLRKDARVQDLNNVINRLMTTRSNTNQTMRSRRGLHLRTFAVTCLSEDSGILEWVPNTNSLRNLVINSYNPLAPPASSKRRGKRMANPGDPTIKQNFEKKCQDTYFVHGDLRRAAALFEELCLKPHPPVLYWWFVQNFPNPHAWYEARNRFTQSAAAWSAVGHVIGLGDRHAENILVDTTSGEIVHVDFDCLFDKGLNLPKPEVVPFRLTASMIDAFGPTGTDGIYTGSLKDAMSTLRSNRDTLLSVLEPFLNDPIIDWKRTRSQQSQRRNSSNNKDQDRQFKEAKRSINVIDERLRGIYNLRNPNSKKVRRTDSYNTMAEQEDEDELTQVMPLSVEGQVHKLVAEATSNENLVQLYVGWMPWV